ncbi:MAG: OmpH family outer membrane protein [Cytophagales bacterium]|nr:OmpH family outer membrane protein [Cytophagales bacterium]MDW8383957.1 OmpH family outer membrane protein [Flammeovirgaceae bacterium]
MKYIQNSILVGLLIFALSLSAQHHIQKIGYVDSDSVLFSLPEYKIQAKSLETYQKQLQTQLDNQKNEIQRKYEDYEKNAANWAPLVLEEKQKEIQQLEQNFYEFQQKAQNSLQQKEQELLKPLFEKIKKGISEVAKERGYTYVLPDHIFLYADKEHDLTEIVIKHLGGTLPSTGTSSKTSGK